WGGSTFVSLTAAMLVEALAGACKEPFKSSADAAVGAGGGRRGRVGCEPRRQPRDRSQRDGKRSLELLRDDERVARIALDRTRLRSARDERERDRDDART